jgi:hypothetical protein
VHESDRRGGKTEQRTAEPGQIGHTSSWARSVVQWREIASTPPGDVEFLARRPRGLHSAHMTTILPPTNPASHGIDPGDPTRVRMIGGLSERLAAEEVQRFVEQAFGAADLDGKRVCLVVPTAPGLVPCRCCWAPRSRRWLGGRITSRWSSRWAPTRACLRNISLATLATSPAGVRRSIRAGRS